MAGPVTTSFTTSLIRAHVRHLRNLARSRPDYNEVGFPQVFEKVALRLDDLQMHLEAHHLPLCDLMRLDEIDVDPSLRPQERLAMMTAQLDLVPPSAGNNPFASYLAFELYMLVSKWN